MTTLLQTTPQHDNAGEQRNGSAPDQQSAIWSVHWLAEVGFTALSASPN